MAHTIINSFVINVVVKRRAFLEARTFQYMPVCGHRSKHYKPEFRLHRQLKNALLPQHTADANLPDRGPSSKHVDFQLHGRYWQEDRTVASYTHGLIDGYDPLKDDKKTWLSPQGMYDAIQTRRKNKKAIKEIQSFDEAFDFEDFLFECEDIYKKANQSVADKDEDKMLDYLTPFAYKIARENIQNKRIHWKYLKTIDSPKGLHVRVATPEGAGNDESFAQITIRHHSQQTLAVYDRFGRLLMGSEILAKDVLELVVYERRLSHLHGKWRVHEKIQIPDVTARTELRQTVVYKEIPEGEEQQKEIERLASDSTQPALKEGETKSEIVAKPDATKQ